MLKVVEINKSFGGVKAIDGVSLKVKNGTINSVIGPNGAGKTSLINVISGFYRADSGKVVLDGADITNIPINQLVYRGVGRTFQTPEVCNSMSLLDNVLLGFDRYMSKNLFATIFRLKRVVKDEERYRERAMALLSLVGIDRYAFHLASELPYGVIKKAEIARALATSPELILLDEPVAGLNPKETDEVAKLIKVLVDDDITVILIEHDMRMVMEISDIITVMHFGKKLAEGSAKEIKNNLKVVEAYLGKGL
jgi:branched-chain amino acid transport system ATP-binding protein